MKKYIVSGLLMLSIIIPVSASALDDWDPNPSTSSCVALTNVNLRYRAKDATTNGEVSELQDFLQAKGYLSSEPTGYFGLLTLTAVKSFQSQNGLNPTGYVGSLTRAKISTTSCGNIPLETNCINFTTGENCKTSNTNVSTTTTITSTIPTQRPTEPCPKGAVYSSENGKPCPTSSSSLEKNLRITIQGAQTNQDSTLYSNTGLSYQVNRGQTYKVYYTSSGGSPVNGLYYVYAGGQYLGTTDGNVKGYMNWTVPQDLTTNAPTFIQFRTNYGSESTGTNVAGQSGRIWVTNVSNFPSGCSSTSGFSTTTGEPCGNTNTPIQTIDLKANGSDGPISVPSGSSILFSWSSVNTTNCGLGFDDMVFPVASSGTKTLSIGGRGLSASILCTGQNGKVNDNVLIGINDTTVTYPLPPLGCTSAEGWSTTTGIACNSQLLPGCTTYSGWSTTTGQACNGTQ